MGENLLEAPRVDSEGKNLLEVPQLSQTKKRRKKTKKEKINLISVE